MARKQYRTAIINGTWDSPSPNIVDRWAQKKTMKTKKVSSLPSPIKNIDVDAGQVASTVNELIHYLKEKKV